MTACDARGLMGFLACCLATLLAGCIATHAAASRLPGQLPGCLAGSLPCQPCLDGRSSYQLVMCVRTSANNK